MTDFKTLYETRSLQFEQLNDQFTAYQQQTSSILNDLEKENNQLKNKLQKVQNQLSSQKEKKKMQTNSLEKELQLIKRQRNQFKTRFQDFQRKVIELENMNQTLQSQSRAANCMLSQYEQRIEKTMEELALLQLQLQEIKENNQEQVARLKSQMKQTEDELMVVRIKHQKHNDQSQHRRSRLSSASFSSQEDMTPLKSSQLDEQSKTDQQMVGLNLNLNPSGVMDFKRNKQTSFHNTISLVSNLINELDNRAKKIRAKKKNAVL